MNVSCFPVAARALSSDSHDDTIVDLRLIGELADEVIDLFRRRAKRPPMPPMPAQPTMPAQPPMPAQPAVPMTENQRVVLARTAGTPISILEHLSNDQSATVRNELVFNPAVPKHILQNLAGDPDRFIAGQARARLADVA